MGMDKATFKFHAWKAAEAELSDIECGYRGLASDLSAADRAKLKAQLHQLKVARLRVRFLFEEVMKESELTIKRIAEEAGSIPAREYRHIQTQQGPWLQ
jgi:hypothetical protein